MSKAQEVRRRCLCKKAPAQKPHYEVASNPQTVSKLYQWVLDIFDFMSSAKSLHSDGFCDSDSFQVSISTFVGLPVAHTWPYIAPRGLRERFKARKLRIDRPHAGMLFQESDLQNLVSLFAKEPYFEGKFIPDPSGPIAIIRMQL